MIRIQPDSPTNADVRLLLDEHLADMFATSPADSVHALDHSALSAPEISFWTAREDGALLGCGALKRLTATQAEIKSMRTTATARGRGVAALLLARILADARERNLERLYLETGTEEFFAPAHRLYARHGFTVCPPFADYVLDPHSVFMTLALAPGSAPEPQHRPDQS
ncbi:GNAT family N-acetyltransferase [Cryobacterium arcticum]|nr:GNAT family N-acetyltransferase [Cryobacterium arcticum]